MARKVRIIEKTINAVLIAPLVGSSLTALPFVFYAASLYGTLSEALIFMVSAVIIGALIGWPAMLVFGLPLHWLICRMKLRYWFIYGILGALIGTLSSIIFFFILPGEGGYWFNGLPFILGAPTGAISAIWFHIMCFDLDP